MSYLHSLITATSLCLASTTSSFAADKYPYQPQPYQEKAQTEESLKLKQESLLNLRENWENKDISKEIIARHLTDKQITAESVLSHFSSDGSWHKDFPEKFTPRVLYRKEAERAFGPHHEYTDELIALVHSYRFGELSEAEKQEIKKVIFNSLEWYFTNNHQPQHYYHQTFNYHRPLATIGGKFLVIGTLLFDEIHSTRAKNPQTQSIYEEISKFCRVFINSAPQCRGPNWSFRLNNSLLYVLFTDDAKAMDEYSYHWNKALSFNRWEVESDGVHPDWSMMHHGDMNYWGMYGTAWTGRVIAYGELFKNTPWAYQQKQYDFIENCLLEGVQWVVYRGACEYSSAPKRASFLFNRTDNVAEEIRKLASRLVKVSDGATSRNNELNHLATKLLLPVWHPKKPSSLSTPERTAHNYYWNTEYQAHFRPYFAIYTQRCSQRSRPPEGSSVRAGGGLHLNYGTGYTPIMRTGEELRFSRLSWDWQQLPGTTIELEKTTSSGKAGSKLRGKNLFSGGVAESHFGCGSFEYEIGTFVTPQKFEYANGAAALKSNFFFDEGMLALGSQIRRVDQGDGDIVTTLNNVRRVGSVTYGIDNKEPITLAKNDTSEADFNIQKHAWFWHDGIGYIIWNTDHKPVKATLSLKKMDFNILKTDRDTIGAYRKAYGNEAWKEGKQSMLRLWTNHGHNPRGAKYAYQVLPNLTVEELAAYCKEPATQFNFLRDTIQTAENLNEGVHYAIFNKAGTAKFGDDRAISVGRPMIVMVRKDNNLDEYVVSAANPVHRGLRRDYIPGEGPSIGELYEGDIPIKLTGFGAETTLNFNFPTKRGEEGGTISQRISAKPANPENLAKTETPDEITSSNQFPLIPACIAVGILLLIIAIFSLARK